MADYSGAQSADVTLQDGDTCGSTSNCNIATSYTIDADLGATIEVYSGRYISIR